MKSTVIEVSRVSTRWSDARLSCFKWIPQNAKDILVRLCAQDRVVVARPLVTGNNVGRVNWMMNIDFFLFGRGSSLRASSAQSLLVIIFHHDRRRKECILRIRQFSAYCTFRHYQGSLWASRCPLQKRHYQEEGNPPSRRTGTQNSTPLGRFPLQP